MSEPTRRAGALGVHSLDHFSLAVPDTSLAEKFYGAFGLQLQNTSSGFGLHTAGHSVTVGMPVTRHPPYRSRRALLTHRAPTSGADVQLKIGIWMHRTGFGQPSVD